MRERLRTINKQFSLIVLLLMVLCFIALPFVLKPTQKEEEVQPQTPEQPIEVQDLTEPEQVHEDFGDEPVEAQQEISFDDLEKRVVLGELKAETRVMQKGDSLVGLLSSQNVPANERMEIVEALELVLDLKSLKPGLTFIFIHDLEGRLMGLSVRQKENESLAVLRAQDDSWVTFSQTGRVETKQQPIQVVVEKTFSGSAQKAGVPNNVINQITGALDGEFDFTTDVKPGDIIDIIMEGKVTQGGLEIGSKQAIYIGLTTAKRSLHKYAYNGTFYDAKGRTSEKTIMKRPLKARPRLSSPFVKRRLPIFQFEYTQK